MTLNGGSIKALHSDCGDAESQQLIFSTQKGEKETIVQFEGTFKVKL